MGTINTRRIKVEWVLKKIADAMNSDEMLYETELIGKFCIHLFSQERTVKEILKQLENAKMIVRKNGKIWTPHGYEADRMLGKEKDLFGGRKLVKVAESGN